MQLYFHKRCLSSRSSHFRFWFLVTFGDEVMKIQKYYVIFVYILQGKVGKMEKKRLYQKDENRGCTKHHIHKDHARSYEKLNLCFSAQTEWVY